MSKSKPWFLGSDDFPEDFIDDFVEKSVVPPVLVSNFDPRKFTRLVLGSLSLSLVEKNRVLDALPTLSCFQCDQLDITLTEEIEQFAQLHSESSIVLRLSAANVIGGFALALHRGAGFVDVAEETAMIQAMGASKRKSSQRLRYFLKNMPQPHPVVSYVYGREQVRSSDIPNWLRKEI